MRQRFNLLHLDHGQRIWCSLCEDEFFRLQHDERQPRPQLVVLWSRRRDEPGEIRRVEFDTAQIVRLEINCEIARLSANDVPRIDSNYIARAEHLNFHRRGRHCAGSAVLLDRKRKLDIQTSAIGKRSLVRVVNRRCDAATRPREKMIFAEVVAHTPTSYNPTICKFSASCGFAARCASSAARAWKYATPSADAISDRTARSSIPATT